MVNVKGITPMIIYTYSTHIIFWEVDGPEILQNYKEFMNSLSHQVFCTHQQHRRRSENTQISGRIERFLQLSL